MGVNVGVGVTVQLCVCGGVIYLCVANANNNTTALPPAPPHFARDITLFSFSVISRDSQYPLLVHRSRQLLFPIVKRQEATKYTQKLNIPFPFLATQVTGQVDMSTEAQVVQVNLI